MNILDIKNPRFLKKLKIKDLEMLSQDIRNFIIDHVSKNGGHLSSNLGITDLTIAIHKVFNSPRDKIIFDVSHQCYTHKILTGRAREFDKLRKIDGLSGFQKRKESKYDSYEAGHSSTSISAALGMALARDKQKKNYHVIAVIGDGSMGNGLPYEAINHLGDIKTRLIIILNDNEMSISKNVGALHNNLDKIRANYKYNDIKNTTKKILNHIPLIGKKLTIGITNLKSSLKKLYLKDGFLFEELGLKYYGPINGHDYHEMLTYLEMAKKETEPVIIHVITEKGKGYPPCENDLIGTWHGVGPFDKETGKFITKNDNLITWSEVISNHLIELTKKHKEIMVITPAMAGGSKLLKYKELYPDNFIDAGIAEEHALLLANGMSLEGLIPFVSIYSTFLQRGYDEVLHDITRMNSPVILGIDRCGIVGEDGETHQGIYDLTFLMPLPNLIISAPKDSIEAGNLLYTAILSKRPFAIRYSKDRLEYQKDNYQIIPIGSWETITEGKDAVLITYGQLISNAKIIKEQLKDDIDLSIINARYLKPIDEKFFLELLNNYKYIFIYEEQTYINSLGSYLVNYANEHSYHGNIKIFAIPDKYIEQGKKEEVLKRLQLDPESITKKIKEIWNSHNLSA
ncbi:MAG: 1-deoxy-D-xylulose-5-phosphate synthase [Bacilli bacterium]